MIEWIPELQTSDNLSDENIKHIDVQSLQNVAVFQLAFGQSDGNNMKNVVLQEKMDSLFHEESILV